MLTHCKEEELSKPLEKNVIGKCINKYFYQRIFLLKCDITYGKLLKIRKPNVKLEYCAAC